METDEDTESLTERLDAAKGLERLTEPEVGRPAYEYLDLLSGHSISVYQYRFFRIPPGREQIRSVSDLRRTSS